MNLTTPFMAKTKPGKKDLDSYTIKGTNKVVRGEASFFFFCWLVHVESESLVFVLIYLLVGCSENCGGGRELIGVCLVLSSGGGFTEMGFWRRAKVFRETENRKWETCFRCSWEMGILSEMIFTE